MLNRRTFLVASAALAAVSKVSMAAGEMANPLLYRVRQGNGVVNMLGVSDATDNGWFVPKITAALDAADVLWLETPPGTTAAASEGNAAPPPSDPELQRLFTVDAFDREHDLFAVLPDEVSRRTLDWAQRVGVARDVLAPMRPWFARITVQQAYAASKQASAAVGQKLVSPERIVIERARQRQIAIESEYPTLTALIRFFANLSPAAQWQYMQELLDYFDRDVAGQNEGGKYGWITGHPDPRSLDEQRLRTPDLYRAQHVERNAWWTGRIEGLLAEGRSAFILIGQNHTLGPDSIQANLTRRGLQVETL